MVGERFGKPVVSEEKWETPMELQQPPLKEDKIKAKGGVSPKSVPKKVEEKKETPREKPVEKKKTGVLPEREDEIIGTAANTKTDFTPIMGILIKQASGDQKLIDLLKSVNATFDYAGSKILQKFKPGSTEYGDQKKRVDNARVFALEQIALWGIDSNTSTEFMGKINSWGQNCHDNAQLYDPLVSLVLGILPQIGTLNALYRSDSTKAMGMITDYGGVKGLQDYAAKRFADVEDGDFTKLFLVAGAGGKGYTKIEAYFRERKGELEKTYYKSLGEVLGVNGVSNWDGVIKAARALGLNANEIDELKVKITESVDAIKGHDIMNQDVSLYKSMSQGSLVMQDVAVFKEMGVESSANLATCGPIAILNRMNSELKDYENKLNTKGKELVKDKTFASMAEWNKFVTDMGYDVKSAGERMAIRFIAQDMKNSEEVSVYKTPVFDAKGNLVEDSSKTKATVNGTRENGAKTVIPFKYAVEDAPKNNYLDATSLKTITAQKNKEEQVLEIGIDAYQKYKEKAGGIRDGTAIPELLKDVIKKNTGQEVKDVDLDLGAIKDGMKKNGTAALDNVEDLSYSSLRYFIAQKHEVLARGEGKEGGVAVVNATFASPLDKYVEDVKEQLGQFLNAQINAVTIDKNGNQILDKGKPIKVNPVQVAQDFMIGGGVDAFLVQMQWNGKNETQNLPFYLKVSGPVIPQTRQDTLQIQDMESVKGKDKATFLDRFIEVDNKDVLKGGEPFGTKKIAPYGFATQGRVETQTLKVENPPPITIKAGQTTAPPIIFQVGEVDDNGKIAKEIKNGTATVTINETSYKAQKIGKYEWQAIIPKEGVKILADLAAKNGKTQVFPISITATEKVAGSAVAIGGNKKTSEKSFETNLVAKGEGTANVEAEKKAPRTLNKEVDISIPKRQITATGEKPTITSSYDSSALVAFKDPATGKIPNLSTVQAYTEGSNIPALVGMVNMDYVTNPADQTALNNLKNNPNAAIQDVTAILAKYPAFRDFVGGVGVTYTTTRVTETSWQARIYPWAITPKISVGVQGNITHSTSQEVSHTINLITNETTENAGEQKTKTSVQISPAAKVKGTLKGRTIEGEIVLGQKPTGDLRAQVIKGKTVSAYAGVSAVKGGTVTPNVKIEYKNLTVQVDLGKGRQGQWQPGGVVIGYKF